MTTAIKIIMNKTDILNAILPLTHIVWPTAMCFFSENIFKAFKGDRGVWWNKANYAIHATFR